MSNEVIYGMPAEQYFAADRINNSSLKLINKSPLHYQSSIEQTREETKAMLIGSAVHCAVLESDDLHDRYVIAPKADKRTNAGKAIWTELEQSGKIVLSQDDFVMIDSIQASVFANDTALKLLGKGKPEVTVFTEINDVPAKSRMDWYRTGIIVDLKTTEDASPAGFARSCATYGYAQQAAWYLDRAEAAGLEAHTFIFLVVEKSAPYAVAIYELTPESLEFGRAQYMRALNRYKECKRLDDWPGYSEQIEQLSLPAWALREAA